jgi:hypothetical protein
MRRTPVKIKHRPTGELVPATLITGVTIREAQLAQSEWEFALNDMLKQTAQEQLPEHSGWNWTQKHRKYGRLSAYQFYGIECDGKMQGLMLLSTLLRPSKIKEEHNKQLIYAVYLASAPWNLRRLSPEPIYSLVGSVLVAAAIEVSRDEDCHGRFALHSLPQAEAFYTSCGMTNLGIDLEHENKLRYFEMTTKAAALFLQETKQ